MRRVLAAWFNERGSKSIDSDKASRGEMLYKLALAVDPRWSVPWYNLGLQTKNSGRRKESLRFNQRALELDPTDEAAWWNLGIAATALHEWTEVSIWKVSEYSTFRVIVHISKDSAEKHLVDLCLAHQLGVEDWTTIRIICAKCSRGNPGAHECEAKPLEDGSRRFGFGAKNEEDLLNVLREWTTANVGADFGEVELVLRAKPN